MLSYVTYGALGLRCVSLNRAQPIVHSLARTAEQVVDVLRYAIAGELP